MHKTPSSGDMLDKRSIDTVGEAVDKRSIDTVGEVVDGAVGRGGRGAGRREGRPSLLLEGFIGPA